MSKVVGLNGKPDLIRQPTTESIDGMLKTLDHLREQVKDGQIAGFWVGLQYSDETTQGAGGGRFYARHMIGLMEVYKHSLIRDELAK